MRNTPLIRKKGERERERERWKEEAFERNKGEIFREARVGFKAGVTSLVSLSTGY